MDLKMPNLPPLDLSYTNSLVSSVQREVAAMNERNLELGNEAYEYRQRVLKAQEETASNTAETNVRLEKVIENQNDYIDLLKVTINRQKEQLDVLENIFSSSEDGVMAEQEIVRLIKEQINSDHPLWEYVTDKGGDLAISNLPIIWGAVKAYLIMRGINLPF